MVLPIGVARHLRTDERMKCGGLIERICAHASSSSYRTACKNFNLDYHREEAGCAIPLMTFSDIVVNEGKRLVNALRGHQKQVLTGFGFGEDGLWPNDKEFPDELCNQEMEYIEIDPNVILSKAGYSPLPAIKFKQGEYSEPETGLHIRKRQRRGSRMLVSDEQRQRWLEDYVLYINTQKDRNPYATIRHPFRVEKYAESVLNIFIDGNLVGEQAEHRIPGGKPEQREEHTTIKHIDIRIESDDGRRYNITSVDLDDAYQRLLAFLLKTGLIKRYFHFFIDGEKILKKAIDKYFSHWHYTIFLDDFHIEEKIKTQTSLGIKGRRVACPWEEPEYYVKGKNKGQIKKQPMTSLSRTYASVLKTMIFYGNTKEAIEYIRHIPEDDIQSKDALEGLVTYLEERESMLTCYALRKHAGLKNSSNASELCNEMAISSRQKVDDRMHWREDGSAALAAITVLYMNCAAKQWFEHHEIAFEPYYVEPTRKREYKKYVA